MAKLFDTQFAVPVLGRVGIDPLIGMIPVAGDIIGYVVSAYIIIEAGLLGLPAKKLVLMAVNAGVDVLTGYVPIAGDLADAVYKANARNVNIILSHFDLSSDAEVQLDHLSQRSVEVSRKINYIIIGLIVAILVILAILIAIPILILYFIFAH